MFRVKERFSKSTCICGLRHSNGQGIIYKMFFIKILEAHVCSTYMYNYCMKTALKEAKVRAQQIFLLIQRITWPFFDNTYWQYTTACMVITCTIYHHFYTALDWIKSLWLTTDTNVFSQQLSIDLSPWSHCGHNGMSEPLFALLTQTTVSL